jgi:8-oxo-dGTP pyrophosphatase MutT (NUDIX family)
MTLRDKIIRFALFLSQKTIPLDIFSRRFPVSVKGIIIVDSKVLLLKNERGEWDLPGGKITSDISAEACLIREIKEETNLMVAVSRIEGTLVYRLLKWIDIFIVIYDCKLLSPINQLQISAEHFACAFFSEEELERLNLYKGYKPFILKKLKCIKNEK